MDRACTKCGQPKPPDGFYPDKSKPTGRHSVCKECVKADRRKRYAQDPELFRERNRASARRNPNMHRATNLRRYGLTIAEYDRMWTEQEGVCAACDQPETATNQFGKRRLAVDHDHTTGRVRGLLCSTCNRALGLLGDDWQRVLGVLAYLEATSDLRGVEDGAA
jgi:hypothetical protein